jgi:hypothetical protein
VLDGKRILVTGGAREAIQASSRKEKASRSA